MQSGDASRGTGTDTLKQKLDTVEVFQNLNTAVDAAFAVATPGDTILFSPAFASFGMFKNEYERNDQFLTLIKRVYIPNNVHMVGVGGIGMSALAQLLASRGHSVVGFDREESPVTEIFARKGVSVSSSVTMGAISLPIRNFSSTAMRKLQSRNISRSRKMIQLRIESLS